MQETQKSRNGTTNAPKLTMQQKLDNDEILQRINRKIDFKKNPRYQTQNLTKISEIPPQQATLKTAQAREGPFRSDPPMIVFSNYEVDRVYEFEIRLVNVSKFMKRIKLAPIKSPEFTVSHVKYPSGESGDIAPGMAARISVWFRPTVLREFGEELIVMSEENVFKIPIIAKREETKINLPKLIDCGNCWVGDHLNTTYNLTNTGGATKFTLNAQNSSQQGQILRVGNFEISPKDFHLNKSQQVQLRAKYSPKSEGKKTETITIDCDNGMQMRFDLVGTGYAAQLALLSINGEKVDPSETSHTVYFEKLVPNKFQESKIVIKNLATVDLKYRWKLGEGSKVKIHPIEGVFHPMQEKTLLLGYQTKLSMPMFESVVLELIGIPPESIMNRAKSSKSATGSVQYYKFDVITCPEPLRVRIQPTYYKFPLPVYTVDQTCTFKLTNQSELDIPYKGKLKYCPQGVSARFQVPKGVIAKRQTIEFNVIFKLQTVTSIPKKAQFVVELQDASPIFFEIEGTSTYPQLKLKTQRIDFGLIKTNQLAQVPLDIINLAPLPTNLEIVNPFSRYFDDCDGFYVFEDEESQPARLSIQPNGGKNLVIGQNQVLKSACTYQAKDCQTFKENILIKLENGTTQSIEVFAQVQDIHVSLSKTSFSLNQIFVGNVYDIQKCGRSRRPLYLLNLGNVQAEYTWDNLSNQNFTVTITPNTGKIPPKSKQKLTVVITPLRTTSLDVVFKCKIQHLKQPLELSVKAEMKGLQVAYHLIDQTQAKKIKIKDDDFGKTKSKKFTTYTMASGLGSQSIGSREREKTVYPILEKVEFFNCQINKPRQMEISLENLSDLDTEFEIQAENFKTLEKEEKEKKTKGALLGSSGMAFTSQMGKTLIANRQLQQSQKLHLSNNKGLSILCQPRSGQLSKNHQVKVKLTLFNDICGRFQDKLVIKIKNHETKVFPVDIDIKGTPVCVSRTQVGINFNKEFPHYKLGVFPVKSGIIRKDFKVVNNGPKPVQIKWKIFPADLKSDQDVFKLHITDPSPGSAEVVKVNWEAIEPEEQKDSLFSIEPKTKILQGREECSFMITFQTSQTPTVKKSILIGQPSLIISETNKTKMELLTIVTQAETISPELSIDPNYRNILTKFQKSAGQNNPKDTRTIILENCTDSSLIFSLQITNDKTFELVQTRSNSQSSNALNDIKLLNSSKTLMMRKTLTQPLQTSFNLVPRTHVEVKIRLNGDCKNLAEWPMLPKTRKEGKLVVSYSNGHTQEFELIGQMFRPVLALNTTGFQGVQGENLIEFGTVHTKNFKNLTIYLTNVSNVAAKWSLKYVKFPTKKTFEPILWTKLDKQDQQIIDDKQCFQFSCTQGVCESLSVPIHIIPSTLALPAPDDQYSKTHIPQKIVINFKPKKNLLYKSKFKITVEEGQPLEFVVRGSGTYVQEKQK